MSGVASALIISFLRAAATAAPLITSSKRADSLASALNYGATLMELGKAGEEKLVELTDRLNALHEKGSTVAASDFDELKERSDDAHAKIQASGEVPQSTAPPVKQPEDPDDSGPADGEGDENEEEGDGK